MQMRHDMPETSFAPGPDTARAFREALGCFGTGVTVVTANGANGPVAMTANSFASVSLDPPLVLWCPAKSSLRHDTFVSAHEFAIHIMSEDQQDIASHFARTGDDFEGLRWKPSPNDVPLLDGCLARFECSHHTCHDGGDHSIVLGKVHRASHRPGNGLMFKRGQFGGFSGAF